MSTPTADPSSSSASAAHALPPITSLRGRVPEAQWQLRVQLAACYRLVAHFGWSDLIFTHISAKLPDVDGEPERFLINPYGLMFDEITASSLVVVDQHGAHVGGPPFPVNRAGFVIHSTIHEARPDVVCVIHTHTRAGVAVSAQEAGLLPLSQQATLVLPTLGYHAYEGLAVHDHERATLAADLGRKSHLILRNHGLLTVARSIPEAFLGMYFLETACQIQIAAMAGARVRPVQAEVLAGVGEAVRIIGGSAPQPPSELAWAGLLRRLDRISPGYDT
ncbi:class II aldolase/adducin family protein [Ramlibacter sp. AN1015]|uniref:class II aldolase/adducin family protein n=1 Tax=Ramlibacter sp. AN1015 TaxID=3133428 RepID=UPI0030C1AEBA